jgi:hypothetical protein
MTTAALHRNQRFGQLLRLAGPFFHAALVLIFLIFIWQINTRIRDGHSGDFRHFYFASGALLDHRDMYGPMPLDVVERSLGRPAGPVERAWYTTDSERYLYPPLIALLYAPIARLRFDTAQRVMLIVDALLAYAGVMLTTRAFVDRFQLPRLAAVTGAVTLLGTLLNFDKIHADLQMFQTNSLMFFMFALSLVWLDRRPIAAGVPLGVILNIKYLSLAMLPWLLVRRRWGTAASCIGSALFFAFVPAVISGWQQNLKDLSVAYGGLLQMIGVHGPNEQAQVEDIRNYLSCSITSAMARTSRESLVVDLDPTEMLASGVSREDVLGRVNAGKFARSAEIADAGKPGLRIVLKDCWITTDALSDITIKIVQGSPVRLGDVAQVQYDAASQSLLRPMLYTAGIAMAIVAVVVWQYRRNGVPVIAWPVRQMQTVQPWKALIGLEFVAIVAATLCFSPQTNTRHLMLALLITIPLSALLLSVRDGLTRTLLIIAAVVLAIGFVWPPGGQAPASHRLALQWFGIGGQCWCLLFAMLVLVSIGVARARRIWV